MKTFFKIKNFNKVILFTKKIIKYKNINRILIKDCQKQKLIITKRDYFNKNILNMSLFKKKNNNSKKHQIIYKKA